MKVVQINTFFRTGGSTGKIVYELKEASQKIGYDAFVAYGYGYNPKMEHDIYRIENKFELTLSKLKTRLLAKHGFYNIRETKRLIKWLEEVNPDVIHMHNLHNHYLNVELLFEYIKKRKIPVVWTLHDCWSFTGWCAYFDYTNCDRWKTLCKNCPNKHEYPFTWFFDRSSLNYIKKKHIFNGVENLTIVTPSKWLSNLVKQSYLQNYKVRVIQNGVDLDIFKPTDSDFRKKYDIGNKIIVLALAMNMSKRKGIDYILQLANKLDQEKFVLIAVGVDESQKKSFNKNIICIGRTSNQTELAAIYSAADVFINPTLEDNFPTTNLESLACGTPVVTFSTGGSPESVDSYTGEVVEKGNLEDLYEAVLRVAHKGKEFYRDNCIKKVERYYSKEIYTQKYLELYKEIANGVGIDND